MMTPAPIDQPTKCAVGMPSCSQRREHVVAEVANAARRVDRRVLGAAEARAGRSRSPAGRSGGPASAPARTATTTRCRGRARPCAPGRGAVVARSLEDVHGQPRRLDDAGGDAVEEGHSGSFAVDAGGCSAPCSSTISPRSARAAGRCDLDRAQASGIGRCGLTACTAGRWLRPPRAAVSASAPSSTCAAAHASAEPRENCLPSSLIIQAMPSSGVGPVGCACPGAARAPAGRSPSRSRCADGPELLPHLVGHVGDLRDVLELERGRRPPRRTRAGR